MKKRVIKSFLFIATLLFISNFTASAEKQNDWENQSVFASGRHFAQRLPRTYQCDAVCFPV